MVVTRWRGTTATTTTMPTETVQEKAQRYVDQGCVKPGRHCYNVRGNTGTWQVTQRRDKSLRCSCPVPAKQMCSHRIAVEIYREKQKAKKECARQMSDETKMVAATQPMAMAPQVARPEPEGQQLDAIWRIAEILSKTAAFSKNVKRYDNVTKQQVWETIPGDPNEVFSVCLAGLDFNLSASSSSRNLKMIKGALSISAELMRARLHQFGYEYELEFEQDEKGKPKSATMFLWRVRDPKTRWQATYTMQEAAQAGLIKDGGGWTNNPEDMLVARVTTRVVRRYAPEVLNKTYLPEELGFYEDDDGQGGTRLVSVIENEEDSGGMEATVEEAEPVPDAAPAAPKKPRAPKAEKPAAVAAPAPAPEPVEDPTIIEGTFEPETTTPGTHQRLDAIPDDELAYLPNGEPANEATKLWELQQAKDDAAEIAVAHTVSADAGIDDEYPEAAEPEAFAPLPEPPTAPLGPQHVEGQAAVAPEPAPEPVVAKASSDELSAEDAKHYSSSGALRGYLSQQCGFRFTKNQNEVKAEAGFPDIEWQDLDEDQRMIVFLCAREKAQS